MTAFDFWLLLMGPVAGSFVTALADRHCVGEPLLAPRSHCLACNARIAGRDLVPLVSWLALRGRCRTCGARLSAHLWLGELAGLLLATLAIWWADDAAAAFFAAIWLWCLLGLFQADRQCQRLPDVLTAPLALSGVALGLLTKGITQTALGVAIGAGGLWLIATGYQYARGRDGLGVGDIKMMAGLGAAVGAIGVPWVTLTAASTALGIATFRSSSADWRTRRVSFGCHLAIAGALVLLTRAS